MNKYMFVAFALFAVVNSVLADDSSEEVLEGVKSKHLKEYLKGHKEHIDGGLEKLEKHCPGVSEKLKAALKSLKECDDKTDDSVTICHAIQSYTLNCTQPLLKVVDDCLPEKARGLPQLGVKSLVSVADHLCKQSGESIFELANPCLWEDFEGENEDAQMQACEKKVQDIAEKYENKDTIPSKDEICTTLTDLRGCVQARTNKACKNQKTKDAALGLWDAVVAPCSSINQA